MVGAGGGAGGGRRPGTEAVPSLALAEAPSRHSGVQGWGSTPTGQTRGAGTTMGPGGAGTH